jgi:adenylate kinase family enzyme
LASPDLDGRHAPAALAAGTTLGKEAQTYMSAGKLVPTRRHRPGGRAASARRREKGFILDGFENRPAGRRAERSPAGLQTPLEHVVQIDVPRELLMERATLRRTDVRTGRIYHLKYSLPPPGAELEHRADDREDKVTKRLDDYEQVTTALVPYYQAKGLLRRVDGTGEMAEVTRRIVAVLGG